MSSSVKEHPRDSAITYAVTQLRTRSDQLFGLAYSNYNLLPHAVAFRDIADELDAWGKLTRKPNQ